MKFIIKVFAQITDALMHYVCIRLQFRSQVLQDTPSPQEAALCVEGCSAKN
jgi:hypothetical protein